MSAIIYFALMVVTYVLHVSFKISVNDMQNFFIWAAIVSIVAYLLGFVPFFNRA
jgi:dolichyl-phosphate-mannose--protein O-mannosyl transferase